MSAVILRPSTLRGQAGWHVWEDPQVCPFYPVYEQALGYALFRATHGTGELVEHDSAGQVIRTFPHLRREPTIAPTGTMRGLWKDIPLGRRDDLGGSAE